ncbi:MAG: hypothetical protein E6J41_31185 [Chloroflexi bacterium]|nr:MAG: hypothetical protein E6J41_31185 [Chloroflexota bacterium]
MARVITRGVAALLLALALAGCSGRAAELAPAPRPSVAPSPALAPAAGGSWPQALTFTGDVDGGMTRVLPDSDAARSECSGRNSRSAGAWASALYGPVGADVYEVLVTVRPYRGPSTYRAPDVVVQVARPDGSAVWETSAGDAATFTVGLGEESGTLSATLTNLSSTATKLRLDGRWSCRT